MSYARVIIDADGWYMASGEYSLQIRKDGLDADLIVNGELIGTIPNAPDFFRAVKAMDREFREHYGGAE